MEKEKMITANDIAEIMDVTKQTVSNWVKSGCPVETNKPRRFYWSKVKKWLEERK